MRNLDVYARQGIPILVAEPSCASALTDDLPDLIEDEALGARVAAQVRLLDEYLGELAASGKLNLPWRSPADRELLVHSHCHHKALFGGTGTLSLLKVIPGARVTPIDAGCCGMAGSFGYEKEHYDLSLKVAEDRLMPALRAASPAAVVVASGFSCRHQVADLTSRRARHAVEIVREAMEQ